MQHLKPYTEGDSIYVKTIHIQDADGRSHKGLVNVLSNLHAFLVQHLLSTKYLQFFNQITFHSHELTTKLNKLCLIIFQFSVCISRS